MVLRLGLKYWLCDTEKPLYLFILVSFFVGWAHVIHRRLPQGNKPRIPTILPFPPMVPEKQVSISSYPWQLCSIFCHLKQASSHEVKSTSIPQARTFPGIPRWQRGSLSGGWCGWVCRDEDLVGEGSIGEPLLVPWSAEPWQCQLVLWWDAGGVAEALGSGWTLLFDGAWLVQETTDEMRLKDCPWGVQKTLAEWVKGSPGSCGSLWARQPSTQLHSSDTVKGRLHTSYIFITNSPTNECQSGINRAYQSYRSGQQTLPCKGCACLIWTTFPVTYDLLHKVLGPVQIFYLHLSSTLGFEVLPTCQWLKL